jgi:MGT family glycosyltransferase
MKKVIFINFPVYGHVNPQLNFCKELAQQNVELIYYTYDKYFSKFDGVNGIELRKYPDSFMDYYNQLAENKKLHKKLLAFLYVFYTLTEKILPFIMDEVEREKPDLIICDSLAIWGKVAARYYNIPYAFFFCGLMGDTISISESNSFKLSLIKSIMFDFPYAIKFTSIRKRIENKYGKVTDKPQDILSHQNKFSIIMTSKEFHPGGNKYPDTVKFIGPSNIENYYVKEEKNCIFISIGTIAFSHTFWDMCIEATKDLDYEIVMSFGDNKNNKVNTDKLPANVKIYNNLSLEEYRKTLKRSVLFISHGGFNSISDSILYMTPLLICPITSEQYSNGKIIEEYNCGKVYATKNTKLDVLKSKINEVINDQSIKVGMEKYRQSFLNSMGYEKAVQELNKEFELF